MPEIWYQVRKKVEDIKNTLPAGVQGPFFNDEFGDTYSIIYAFSADGFSNAELKNQVEQVRQELMYVKNVSKIDIFGAQDRKIFVEFSHRKLRSCQSPWIRYSIVSRNMVRSRPPV